MMSNSMAYASFAEIFENVTGEKGSDFDMSERMYDSAPKTANEFVELIRSGVNGVYGIFADMIEFFLDVPVLSLLLGFGMALCALNLIRAAIKSTYM